VTAVFERFTERAIKAVMLAQQEAKALGRAEVGNISDQRLFLALRCLLLPENRLRCYRLVC